MGVYNIYVSLLKLGRALQIISIIMRHALANFFSFANLTFVHRTVVQHKVHSTPERMRMLIEELGPTYVKFGQIVADRPDVVSDRFRHELKKLQNDVLPFDTNLAIVLIEKELGKTIGSVFREFEIQPIAAASIGQVYGAILKNGCRVIVKIQRPNIESKIKLDIYLMKYLARHFANKYPEMKAINIEGLVDDFAVGIMEELDFTREAKNTAMFHRMFKDNPNIKIPKVWDDYTTRHLLIIERIVGTTPTDAETLREAGLDPKAVINNGANAIFQMILHNGVFHADPHPGNLFILPNNVIAFIDFGMIGIMRPTEIDFIADYTIGYSKRDNILITKALIKLCGTKFFEYEEDVRYDIRRMLLHSSLDGTLDIRNFAYTLQASIDIVIKYNMQIPSGVFMLLKTLLTLEKFSMKMQNDVDLSTVILPFSKEIIKNRYSSQRVANDIYETVSSYISMIKDLPENINEILYKLKEGKIKHDIKLEDESKFNSTVKSLSLRISYVLLLIGVFIGSSILIVLDYETRFGSFLLYGSTAMMCLLLLTWLFRKK